MLSLYTRGKSRVSDAPYFGVRRFQKKKITAAEVQEALEKKKKQKKTFLETYYAKWGKKDGKVVSQEEERDNVQAESGKKTKSLRQKMRMPDDKYANLLSTWAMKRLKTLHEKNAEATEVVMSSAAKQKARDLHNQEPHYWTPNRLGHFFKCSIEKMRGILYEGKLLAEYKKRGLPIDEEDLKIDDYFGEIFGAVDFPNTYEDTPDEIPIRKIHNPWYYVDPGIKSGNLLRFLRTRETRHYKEASRIPAQQFPKHQVFPEVLGKDATGKRIKQKPTPPHKIAKMVMYDSAVRYHLYDRPILIRDHDNTWRTATWEERRRVENSKRQIKYPFHQPFLPDNDSQMDFVAVKDKPPRGFDVGFGSEDYFDDMLSSGKLDKGTRQFLREEENLVPPPNFEKVMKNFARMTSKVGDAVPADEDLEGEEGFDNLEGIERDDFTSTSTQRLRRKNDQFTRNLLNYRVRYQVE